MPKEVDSDESQDLLDALESIKGLLEKGESKLSAARASLAQAKTSNDEASNLRSAHNEPVVPVLDDVVLTPELEEEDIPVLSTSADDIPVLDDIPALDDVVATLPAGHSTATVLAWLDDLQARLEKQLHESLLRSIVNIEADLKETLQLQFQALREQIEEEDGD
jgi:predicted component of type VI protein secretion system